MPGPFGDVFETYEQVLVSAVFAPWAARLVQGARVGPGERVLDLACGTGAVARAAAARVAPDGTVTGLDVAPGMLRVARRAGADVQPPITWIEADAAAIPLEASSFDVVLCQQGLQFVPDRVAVLAEARRALVPEGRIAVSVWGAIERSPAVAATQRVLERQLPEAAGFFPAIFALSDPAELRGHLRDAGFRGVSVAPDSLVLHLESIEHYLQIYVRSTPVGLVLASLPPERREGVEAELRSALGEFAGSGGMELSQEVNLGLAHR